VLLPTIWGGPRAYGSASQAGAAGPPNLHVWRTPSPVAGTNVIPVPRPPSTAREAKPCVTPIGCPRRISIPRAGDRPARTGMRSSGTTNSPGTASAVLDAADDVAGERAAAEPTEARLVCRPAERRCWFSGGFLVHQERLQGLRHGTAWRGSVTDPGAVARLCCRGVWCGHGRKGAGRDAVQPSCSSRGTCGRRGHTRGRAARGNPVTMRLTNRDATMMRSLR